MKIERQLGVSIRTQIARKKETQTYSSAFQRRNRCPLTLQLGKCDFCTCFKRRLPAELWRGWRNHVGNKRSRILRKRLSRKTEIDKRALNIAGSPSCNEKIVPIPLTSRPLKGNITIRDSSSIRRRDRSMVAVDRLETYERFHPDRFDRRKLNRRLKQYAQGDEWLWQ